MLVGPDGPISASAYLPPPPPPPKPASQQQIDALQGKVNSAATTYTQDSSQLRAYQASIATEQGIIKKYPNTYDSEVASSQINGWKPQLSTLQTRVNSDRAALTTARHNLAAAKAVPKAANAYSQKAPGITVSNPVTKAVTPVLKKALSVQAPAQANVDRDEAAIAAENSNPGAGLGAIKRAEALQQQLTADQRMLAAANAKVAAARSVLYSQQLPADQGTVVSQFTKLHGEGILNGDGTLKVSASSLSPKQRIAYDKYVAAATRYGNW
jgi:hypothetical protein